MPEPTPAPTVAGPTPDLQQAIHAAHEALAAQCGLKLGGEAKRYAHVAVTTAWGIATGSANQHHWKRTAVNKMEQLQAAQAEVEHLRGHILDIDAHATPHGDHPDDPGYVGVYLIGAGPLHRALGRIGHASPSCDAEAQLKRAREFVDLVRAYARNTPNVSVAHVVTTYDRRHQPAQLTLDGGDP